MCRLAAYFGQPLFLEELIAKPRHSLMQQSLHADRAKVQTNGDGFGVGWYGDRVEPGVYREVMPAWSDDNLLALSQTLRSRLFFAHVRAATTGGISRHNCHPFRHGCHLFMHNGQIGGYGQLRRTMETWLPDTLYAARQGSTDSELLFLLALARVQDGLKLADAMRSVLTQIATLMLERGVEAPLRFAAALSDGEQLIAFRVSTDTRPPSLYLRQCDSGTIVASEPLCDAEPGWAALPAGAVVTVDARGCRIEAFSLTATTVATVATTATAA